jgi:hypothetical protein
LPLDLGAFGRGGLHAQYRPPTVSPRRDGGFSIAPNPVSCFHRRHIVPAFSRPGFPLAGPAFGCGSFVCRKLLQPCPSPVRRAVWPTPPDTPSRNRQHASTRAPLAARSSPANPFLESPADSGTRAPNLQRLRQSGDARQDLVRISESTTKYGDCGEESGGNAQVSKIRGESERALRALASFHSRREPNRGPRALVMRHACRRRPVGKLLPYVNTVTLSSRKHGDFPPILSEISRNSRDFCAVRRDVSSQAFESPTRLSAPRSLR